MALAALMTMALAVPAYAATGIDIDNSAENVVTDTLNKTTGTTHFATDNVYDGPVGGKTNTWNAGQIREEVKVTAVKTCEFTITIPKEITMDGANKNATYDVNVVGDIAGDQEIIVRPDADFQLNEDGGKAPVTVTVTQAEADQKFVYAEINEDKNSNGTLEAGTDGKTVHGTLDAPTLTAGKWSGKFNFNIEFREQAPVVGP